MAAWEVTGTVAIVTGARSDCAPKPRRRSISTGARLRVLAHSPSSTRLASATGLISTNKTYAVNTIAPARLAQIAIEYWLRPENRERGKHSLGGKHGRTYPRTPLPLLLFEQGSGREHVQISGVAE
ncbi:unnamed protein product [Clonostachys byssicola]|uniref:Uncharacterized protein n=1 Tax=Clonostachys byssicola TaxID=160290 RepID=A0A9N9UED8_9HYPO|nr:unnamed protein product [Clonostachys byssicola]